MLYVKKTLTQAIYVGEGAGAGGGGGGVNRLVPNGCVASRRVAFTGTRTFVQSPHPPPPPTPTGFAERVRWVINNDNNVQNDALEKRRRKKKKKKKKVSL